MAIQLLAAVLKLAAIVILNRLLRQRSKGATRAEPPRVDPASPDTPIPLVFGTCKVPLYVVGFYGASSKDIYKKSRLFGSPALYLGKTKVATRWSWKIAALIGHGPVTVFDLYVDGRSITAAHGASPSLEVMNISTGYAGGAVTLDAAGLLGGDDYNGGVYGPMRVHPGRGTNGPDALMTTRDGDLSGASTPDWRHYAYLVFDNTWIGNTPTLPPLHAVVQRVPAAPLPWGIISGAAGDAEGDANGAHILWELLTNPETGAGWPVEALDQASFNDAAEWVRGIGEDGFGMSFAVDRRTPADTLIADIERVLDASLYDDPTTGKRCLWLHRAPGDARYGTAGILTLDRSAVAPGGCTYTEPQPAALVNEVRVKYVDRARGYRDAVVVATNLALQQAMGRTESVTIDMIGLSNERMAKRVVARELRALTTPLARVRLVCNRRPMGLHRGRQFRFDPRGLVPGVPLDAPDDVVRVMRVTELTRGAPDAPEVTIEAIDDVYAFPVPNPDAVVTEAWDDPVAPAGFLAPTVDEGVSQTAATGTLTLDVTDPQDRVTLVEFLSETGATSGPWTPATGVDIGGGVTRYTATVTRDPQAQSRIGWRVTYTTLGGDDEQLEGAVAFDVARSVPMPTLGVEWLSDTLARVTATVPVAGVPVTGVRFASGTAAPSDADVTAAGRDDVAPFSVDVAVPVGESRYVRARAELVDGGTTVASPITPPLLLTRSATAAAPGGTFDLSTAHHGDLLYVDGLGPAPALVRLSIPDDWSSVDYVLGIAGGVPAWRPAIGTIVEPAGLYPSTDLFPSSGLFPDASP